MRFTSPTWFSSLILVAIIFAIANWTPIGGLVHDVAMETFAPLGGSLSRLHTPTKDTRNMTTGNLTESLIAVSKENMDLRKRLQLQSIVAASPEINRLVAARIILRERINSKDEIILDVGSDAGISIGQPVLNSNGTLVGVTTNTTETLSRVRLISDVHTNIAVRTATSDVEALLTTDGDTFYLNYVPAESDIYSGELILTSGLGGTLPHGLPIGLVDQLERSENSLLASVTMITENTVQPSDNLFVVIDFVPWSQNSNRP